MEPFSIEQALFGQTLTYAAYGAEAATAIVPLGRSAGFGDEWTPHAEEMIRGFGERPAGVRCPLAVFAQPFAGNGVAVVQVADQPDNMLAFHFLVLGRDQYEKFLGDPFHLAQKLPADWQQRGTLPTHSWPSEALPERTIAEVRQVLQRLKTGALSENWEPPAEANAPTRSASKDLKTANHQSVSADPQIAAEPERTVENSESPALLGGTQVLVDGGRVFFHRPAPDLNLIQGLWTLLPNSTRRVLWPASFAFENHLQFDAVVLPRPEADELEGYTSEEQAIDYPEGRYELNLQIAAETGDQQQLDGLLNRRSVWETWRLGLYLLALMIGLVLVSGAIDKLMPKIPPPSRGEARQRAMSATSVVAAGDQPWLAAAIIQAGKIAKIKQEE